jgi:transcriptional regulator with XRE-family HTH domain
MSLTENIRQDGWMTQDRLTALLATTLRRQRELRGLTQQGLAERAGVSQATITRIENGDRAPSTAMVEKLLGALGVQLTVDVEPLDAHLDRQPAELGSKSTDERIDDSDLRRVTEKRVASGG